MATGQTPSATGATSVANKRGATPGNAKPPPTTGQIWPRGNKTS